MCLYICVRCWPGVVDSVKVLVDIQITLLGYNLGCIHLFIFSVCPFDQLQVPENAREWFDNHRLYNKLPPGQTNCRCDQQGFDGQQPVLKHRPLNISIGDWIQSCDSFCRWNFSPWRITSKISTGTWQLDMEPKCVPTDMAPTVVNHNKKQTNKPLRAKAALNAGKGVLLVGGSSRWVCKKKIRVLWYTGCRNVRKERAVSGAVMWPFIIRPTLYRCWVLSFSIILRLAL